MATTLVKETFGTFADGVTPAVWYVKEPTDGSPSPWPAAVFAHPGRFMEGSAFPLNIVAAMEALAAEGIICFSVQNRLARKKISGQQSLCFWPGQTDDYKQAVKAVRLDSRVDGTKVGGVGGSSGAALLLGCASEAISYGVDWTAEDRLKWAVLLSGPYQYDDRTSDPNLKSFTQSVQNYCQTTDLSLLRIKSPTAYLDSTCSPLFIVNGEFENMPKAQYYALTAACDALAIDTHQLFIPSGTAHAFDNWGSAVNDGVIDWIAEQNNA